MLIFSFSARNGIRHRCRLEPMSSRRTCARIAIIKGAGLSTWSGWNARVVRHSTRVESSSERRSLRRTPLTTRSPLLGRRVWLVMSLSSGIALEQHRGCADASAFGHPSLSIGSRIQNFLVLESSCGMNGVKLWVNIRGADPLWKEGY